MKHAESVGMIDRRAVLDSNAVVDGTKFAPAYVSNTRQVITTFYICYFGIREPLVQTQVVTYLRELGAHEIQPTLLTFEPRDPAWTASERKQYKKRLCKQGIRWISLRYHKFPSLPATAYDILLGNLVSCCLVIMYRIDVIHARGHVPAAMATLARVLRLTKLVFDIRGFMPEEYVDAGVWPAGGTLYRITKAVERWLLASADAFVVLTHRAREILFPGCRTSDSSGRPIEVIPCCADMEKFEEVTDCRRELVRKKLQVNERRVLIYVGALGSWYLTSEMAEFIGVAHQRDSNVFALVLTQSGTQAQPFKNRLRELGLSPEDYLVATVSPDEVPEYMAAADFAFCFIKPTYSKLASSPTKIGEFLACGIPVLCNSGIGDTEDLLVTNKVGVTLEKFDRESYICALDNMDKLAADINLRQRCREIATEHLDLSTVGHVRYQRLYRRVGKHGKIASVRN
jgi:glycosyltransferase involved in cell wall biosynthesis